jgi:hypothetical protein
MQLSLRFGGGLVTTLTPNHNARNDVVLYQSLNLTLRIHRPVIIF